MTQMAWTFMGIAWSIIIGCTLYCFVKLLWSEQKQDDTL